MAGTGKKINFDTLLYMHQQAMIKGHGSKSWIEFATEIADIFPSLYETAKAMNTEAYRLRNAETEAKELKGALRNLMATIELHTDCMDNRIDREALDPYIEKAEELLQESIQDIAA